MTPQQIIAEYLAELLDKYPIPRQAIDEWVAELIDRIEGHGYIIHQVWAGRPDPGQLPYDPDDDATKTPERGYR